MHLDLIGRSPLNNRRQRVTTMTNPLVVREGVPPILFTSNLTASNFQQFSIPPRSCKRNQSSRNVFLAVVLIKPVSAALPTSVITRLISANFSPASVLMNEIRQRFIGAFSRPQARKSRYRGGRGSASDDRAIIKPYPVSITARGHAANFCGDSGIGRSCSR